MRVAFEPRTVTVLDAWEQPIGEKNVVGRCSRCERSVYAKTAKRIHWEVVSPAGVEHLGGDGHQDGATECGIDATGDDWWWAL